MSVDLAWREDGPGDGPPVLLGASLGTTMQMWDELAAELSDAFRVIRFDTRGHGGSPVPPGPYSVSDLSGDVVTLADRLGLDRFAFVGLSLGGALGQVLALDHGARLSSVVLCCTAPVFGEPSGWTERASLVRSEGMGSLAEPTKERWFTAEFRASHPEQVDRFIAMITGTPAEGYAACCDALADFDVTSRLAEIACPTRVVAGSEDKVAPPDVGRRMADAVRGADLVVIDGAGHIASVARPEEFHTAVRTHLERHA